MVDQSERLTTTLAGLGATYCINAGSTGVKAAVAIAASLTVDKEISGNSLGVVTLKKETLAAFLKASPASKASSFQKYWEAGKRLNTLHSHVMVAAFNELRADGRNTFPTTREAFDACHKALTLNLPGALTNLDTLRDATVAAPVKLTKGEKTDRQHVMVVGYLNKLTNANKLEAIATMVLARAVALRQTGGDNIISVMAEADALCAAIVAAHSPAVSDGSVVEAVEEAA